MTQIAHDGAEVVLDPSKKQIAPAGRLTAEEREYSETQRLLAPFDPGVPWDQGGRILTEQTVRLNASVVAEGCVQIGRSLIYAKGQLAHGEWMPWLEEQGIDARHAQRMMLLAARFADFPALANLSRTKAVALLGMSDDQLQQLNDGSVVDTLRLDAIEKMSARELQAEIKRLKKREEKGKEQLAKKDERIEQLEAERDAARGLSLNADDRLLALLGRLKLDLEDFERLIRETRDGESATRIWAHAFSALREIRDANLDLISLGALFAAGAAENTEEEDILERAEQLADDDEFAEASTGGAR
ncbi:MAG: DUF3102 domain-containing protein [Phycisphaeraceae bacterium]|nr:DUF3102 domain-containing protein [Phycisphaeraceae bacterium]